MKRNLLATIFSAITGILCLFSPQLVAAETIDTLISGNPNRGEISGTDSGNNLSFETIFALDQIPLEAEILSANLEYSQTNTSAGLIRFIDKYSTDVIDSKLLNTTSNLSVNNILVYVMQWHKEPATNFGLLIQGAALQETDQIFINTLTLRVTYTLPDTIAPIIIEVKTEDILSQSAKIKIITDEETKIKINYGKTSLYGSEITSEVDLYATEHILILTELNSGQTYHFSIEAIDRFSNSSKTQNSIFETLLDSEPNNNTPINFSLTPPAGLKADVRSQDEIYSINLSWTPATEAGLKGYIIYRATDIDKTYKEYKIIENQTANFIDEDVETNHIYYYYIRSYTLNQISPKSAELAVDVKPIVDKKPAEPATLQTFLFTLALAAILLFGLYIVIKVLTNIEQKNKKGLVNVLKDPEFYK